MYWVAVDHWVNEKPDRPPPWQRAHHETVTVSSRVSHVRLCVVALAIWHWHGTCYGASFRARAAERSARTSTPLQRAPGWPAEAAAAKRDEDAPGTSRQQRPNEDDDATRHKRLAHVSATARARARKAAGVARQTAGRSHGYRQ